MWDLSLWWEDSRWGSWALQWRHSTWNLSSLTRDQSHGPCNGGGIPNLSTAGGVPETTFQISVIMALFLEAGLFFSKCDFQTDFFMNAAALPNTILAKVKMKTWL